VCVFKREGERERERDMGRRENVNCPAQGPFICKQSDDVTAIFTVACVISVRKKEYDSEI
jgi:hypothetical protein